MPLPEVFLYDASDSVPEAASDLASTLSELGAEAPFVIASQHGAAYARAIATAGDPCTPGPRADQDWAMDTGSAAKRAGADSIVAIGGGRVLDLGKLVAARAGLKVIVVPTQLSHDGICSPVAVVLDDDGRSQSLGAVEPHAVYLSIPTLLRAPLRSFAAGLGDLIANPLALRDWRLAAEHGLEEIDQPAWDLSAEAYSIIESYLDGDLESSAADAEFVKLLAQALILSGESMIASGDSRPASGAEHEISHAIDHLYGGRALHGEQVAFGCIVSVALYGDDPAGLIDRLKRLGLPTHPADLGLDAVSTEAVLLEAPETRPGRFTIIEDADLDPGSVRALIEKIWP
jgi:glycerol-1-phosphate dehydrogenase [NAD(P)+]